MLQTAVTWCVKLKKSNKPVLLRSSETQRVSVSMKINVCHRGRGTISPWGPPVIVVRYLSLRLPLQLLPVEPARVRLPLESPESFRVRVPTCSLELALLTVLGRRAGRGSGFETEREGREKQMEIGEVREIGHETTWRCFSKNSLRHSSIQGTVFKIREIYYLLSHYSAYSHPEVLAMAKPVVVELWACYFHPHFYKYFTVWIFKALPGRIGIKVTEGQTEKEPNKWTNRWWKRDKVMDFFVSSYCSSCLFHCVSSIVPIMTTTQL